MAAPQGSQEFVVILSGFVAVAGRPVPVGSLSALRYGLVVLIAGAGLPAGLIGRLGIHEGAGIHPWVTKTNG